METAKKTTLSLRRGVRFAAWLGNCVQRMPDLACRLSWEKKDMCASFAPDNDSLPGKPVLNRTITLRDTWAKEAQRGLVLTS